MHLLKENDCEKELALQFISCIFMQRLSYNHTPDAFSHRQPEVASYDGNA